MWKLMAAAAVALFPVAGANAAEPGSPPERIRSITLLKGQTCPKAVGNEVVVCSALGDPYRIPAPLRNSGPIPAANQAWANRAATVADVSRTAAGLPDTCSAIGTGGQSGCTLMWNRQWRAERNAMAAGAGPSSADD